MKALNNLINKRHNGFVPFTFFVRIILLYFISLFLPPQLHAQETLIQTNNAYQKNIIIVYQTSQKFSQQLIENLLGNFKASDYQAKKLILTPDNKPQTLNYLSQQKNILLIAIGSATTKTLLDAKIDLPILSTLIPRHVFKSLKQTYKNKKNWSGLFINQPISRQFHLISAVIGKNKKTAVLLGPYTKDLSQPLKEVSANISIREIEISEQVPEALNSLNKSFDVLLTIPDPVIYNRNTLRQILLSSYRNKLPLIGFSQAYVKAGAVAAIYSKPEQISDQISRIVKQYFMLNEFENLEYYPDDFSVALNKKIARSLGINLASNQTIIKQIKKAEIN